MIDAPASLPHLAAVAEAARSSVVQICPGVAGGVGVVFERNGERVIVTNAHVARGTVGSRIAVVTAQGLVLRAQIEQRHTGRDLALLTLPPGEPTLSDLVPAQMGNLATVRPGHLVVAVGHPFGLANAVSTGILQSVGPVWSGLKLPFDKRRLPWIQADVRLAPGNSGGPLCEVSGRVIGINTMIIEGLALAAPISEVRAFLQLGSRPARRSA